LALREANVGLSWEAFAVNVYKRWEHRVYAGTSAARANACAGDIGKPSAIPTPICMPTMTGTFTKRVQVRDGKCTLARDGRQSLTRGKRSVLDQWQFGRRLSQQRRAIFIHFRDVSCDWAETQASNSWRSHS
jgi:hypothetical protein